MQNENLSTRKNGCVITRFSIQISESKRSRRSVQWKSSRRREPVRRPTQYSQSSGARRGGNGNQQRVIAIAASKFAASHGSNACWQIHGLSNTEISFPISRQQVKLRSTTRSDNNVLVPIACEVTGNDEIRSKWYTNDLSVGHEGRWKFTPANGLE